MQMNTAAQLPKQEWVPIKTKALWEQYENNMEENNLVEEKGQIY